MIRRPRLAATLCAACVFVTGCTGADSAPPSSVGGSSASVASSAPSLASVAETVPSLTPVTDAGLVTGPGVDDAALSLGLVVDAERDQGFSTGVRLWARAFNGAGGVCGRTVELITASSAQRGADAYRYLAASSLGLITLPALDDKADLGAKIAADRLPAVTPEGALSDLETTGGPIVLGATSDILAINTAAHWIADGTLAPGSTVGVYLDLSDGDLDATDAAAALQWWATRAQVELVVIRPGEQIPTAVSAIYAPGSAAGVEQLVTRVAGGRGLAAAVPTGLATTPTAPGVPSGVPTSGSGGVGSAGSSTAPSTTTPSRTAPSSTTPVTRGPSGAGPRPTAAGGPIAIATDVDGVGDVLRSPTAVGAVTVASVTPAYPAVHPIGSALAQAFASAGLSPGLRSFEGYAMGEAWGRVLGPMCAARTLTRSASTAQWIDLAPAAADSIIGPTQPSNQLTATLPNSRVSALSVVDPTQDTGVRPLTLLESASDIGAYRATG
ncbi:hypothetical protein ABLG96_18305 [Nakamurella sp. A5-74]|uniref:Leucine-binding protein domain-containing protein n=1 Tax=Nakamurella sp. A5-74 TaxID=3158264 RepID=A0AAU8DP47_9ACTN